MTPEAILLAAAVVCALGVAFFVRSIRWHKESWAFGFVLAAVICGVLAVFAVLDAVKRSEARETRGH